MHDPIRVMLVDDHVFWRHALRHIIDAQPDMRVVAEAGEGRQAQHTALATQPDLILMDINLPGMGGLEVTRVLNDLLPATRIVMLTVSDTDDDLLAALRCGAIGFLLKDVLPDDLVQAIRGTMQGESVLSPFLAARVLQYIRRGGLEEHPKRPSALTEREEEILGCIASGARDREIASQLFISESTVKKHVQNILRKLHARNRVEAVSHLRAR